MNLYWLETPTERILLSCSRFRLDEHCENLNATVAYQLGLSDPKCQLGVVLRVPHPFPKGVETNASMEWNLTSGVKKWEAPVTKKSR